MHDILSNGCVDFFAISETKIDPSFPNAQFNVDGFTIYRQDNTSSSGGLLIYVRSDIPHRRLPLAEINDGNIETVCIEVTVGKVKTVIASVYKHPKVGHEIFRNQMCMMADKLLLSCADFVLMGDMNCCPTKSDTIKYLCDTYGLTNLIKKPTCHKGEEGTLLDVILVTNSKKYAGVSNSEFCLSDFHNLIGAATKRHAPSKKPREIIYRSFKNFTENEFRETIASAPFHVSDIFDDVDDAAWFTNKLIGDICDHHAPRKSKLLKCTPVPYMNANLRKAQYKRNIYRNKVKKYGKSHWEEYRRQRNAVVSVRKKSIAKYFQKNCSKHDKSFWSAISPFMSTKHRNEAKITLKNGEMLVTDDNEVANIFNDYFSTIAVDIGDNDAIISVSQSITKYENHPSVLKIKCHFPNAENTFRFREVSLDEIKHKLKSMKTSKATGYDNISGKLLRHGYEEFALPVKNMINLCLSKNIFPAVMKFAEVSPLFKKEDNLIKENYRPVSILSSLSKIYESVVNDQLREYFIDKLSDLLTAYRKSHSCQSLLIRFIEDIKKSLDDGLSVGTVLMDLSKAYDSLPHGLLISKLHAYGVSLSGCSLLFSYLTERKQRVKIASARSEWATLSKGVPQGSILGPLLFNIFINDMFFFIDRCALYNYADDNTISCSANNICDVLSGLQHGSEEAIKWFINNGMRANPKKFHFIIWSKRDYNIKSISINKDNEITSEQSVKLLGVHFDRNLNFHEHISHCCKKAARQLNALTRISRYLDVKSRTIIYNSFIRSNFDYCPLIWHFCGKRNTAKLEKIQERALRILHKDYLSSYESLLNIGNTPLLSTRRMIALITEVYKSLQKINPAYLQTLFPVKDESYNLRDSCKIIQPMKRTTKYGLNSLTYLGAKLWNMLPCNIKSGTYMDAHHFKETIHSLNIDLTDGKMH
jgi:hypothetical protein